MWKQHMWHEWLLIAGKKNVKGTLTVWREKWKHTDDVWRENKLDYRTNEVNRGLRKFAN